MVDRELRVIVEWQLELHLLLPDLLNLFLVVEILEEGMLQNLSDGAPLLRVEFEHLLDEIKCLLRGVGDHFLVVRPPPVLQDLYEARVYFCL